jgi:transposase-like protein
MICPKCGSGDTKKYGMGHRKRGPVQQYRCKTCGHIFIEKTKEEV